MRRIRYLRPEGVVVNAFGASASIGPAPWGRVGWGASAAMLNSGVRKEEVRTMIVARVRIAGSWTSGLA